jgi:hypothetical protein
MGGGNCVAQAGLVVLWLLLPSAEIIAVHSHAWLLYFILIFLVGSEAQACQTHAVPLSRTASLTRAF